MNQKVQFKIKAKFSINFDLKSSNFEAQKLKSEDVLETGSCRDRSLYSKLSKETEIKILAQSYKDLLKVKES